MLFGCDAARSCVAPSHFTLRCPAAFLWPALWAAAFVRHHFYWWHSVAASKQPCRSRVRALRLYDSAADLASKAHPSPECTLRWFNKTSAFHFNLRWMAPFAPYGTYNSMWSGKVKSEGVGTYKGLSGQEEVRLPSSTLPTWLLANSPLYSDPHSPPDPSIDPSSPYYQTNQTPHDICTLIPYSGSCTHFNVPVFLCCCCFNIFLRFLAKNTEPVFCLTATRFTLSKGHFNPWLPAQDKHAHWVVFIKIYFTK